MGFFVCFVFNKTRGEGEVCEVCVCVWGGGGGGDCLFLSYSPLILLDYEQRILTVRVCCF